ncbi:TPA: hypothetical protein IAA86_08105 [Candidatus Galligastranaerophilus intestinavium]|uniref:Uncharacterized protein n=1 Tax=Candidatus Galligastranaerophilus intestinavium TaxID=2840836 RepID=A0A9D1JXX6_9BACT|nr:hypothetical protein [Candidatus Galligastranaerophilus intestinavium]
MQQSIQANIRRMRNFLGFSRSFLIRKNPLKIFSKEFATMLKNFFSMNKKRKMVKYRLNYQLYKLNQMEKLIAQNNDHVFLRGNKFNEMR